MGSLRTPAPVKLFAGLLYRDTLRRDEALRALTRAFGPVDHVIDELAFTGTDYYTEEFGAPLTRAFVGFRRLIRPEQLPGIKRTTNRIEKKLSRNGKRTVNIDPGYLTMAKVVLATTKDYCHRVYLGKGIFAETTMVFRGGVFGPTEFTYPDYRSSAYARAFAALRALFARQQPVHP